MYSNVFKFIQIYSNLFKFIQIYSNLFKFIQIYLNISLFIISHIIQFIVDTENLSAMSVAFVLSLDPTYIFQKYL